MYCTNCGAQFEGNFCSHCGTPRASSDVSESKSSQPATRDCFDKDGELIDLSVIRGVYKDKAQIADFFSRYTNYTSTEISEIVTYIFEHVTANEYSEDHARQLRQNIETSFLNVQPTASAKKALVGLYVFAGIGILAILLLILSFFTFGGHDTLGAAVILVACAVGCMTQYQQYKDPQGCARRKADAKENAEKRKQEYQTRETTRPPTKSERIRENKRNAVACCPKCGSTSLSANKKGFGIGKAVVGAWAAGPIGLVAGNVNAKKVWVTCLNCRHRWKM